MNLEQPAHKPTAGEIQQGVAYPPPPSYYENMQLPAKPPLLPEKKPGAPITRPVSGPVSPPAPTPGPNYRPVSANRQSPYAPSRYPHPPIVSPIATSRRQAWVIVAIISVSVILLVGAGIWAVATIYGGVSEQGMSANQ